MRRGIAVVRYDCSSLKLLNGCSADGTYSFSPVSMKTEVQHFGSKQDLLAHLGGHLVYELDGSLFRNRTLDVAMISEGAKQTNAWHLDRSALRGGGDCDGATHFIQGALVGAFAIGLETQGEARSASSIFSGSGQDNAVSRYRDGQHDKCEQLPDDAKAPSPACDALIRLQLVAIEATTHEAIEVDGQASAATLDATTMTRLADEGSRAASSMKGPLSPTMMRSTLSASSEQRSVHERTPPAHRDAVLAWCQLNMFTDDGGAYRAYFCFVDQAVCQTTGKVCASYDLSSLLCGLNGDLNAVGTCYDNYSQCRRNTREGFACGHPKGLWYPPGYVRPTPE
jgi:hypothetical protein